MADGLRRLKLPQRPAMGCVILHSPIYDDAKRLGHDMTGFIRGEPVPMIGPAPEIQRQIKTLAKSKNRRS